MSFRPFHRWPLESAAVPSAPSWLVAAFAHNRPPAVLHCGNCGAPLETRCICRNVIGVAGVIGRAIDPACAASKHAPGRLVCRFCGVDHQ
jgi:hypothetical protein